MEQSKISVIPICILLAGGIIAILLGGYWTYYYLTIEACSSCSHALAVREQGIGIGLLLIIAGILLFFGGNVLMKRRIGG